MQRSEPSGPRNKVETQRGAARRETAEILKQHFSWHWELGENEKKEKKEKATPLAPYPWSLQYSVNK